MKVLFSKAHSLNVKCVGWSAFSQGVPHNWRDKQVPAVLISAFSRSSFLRRRARSLSIRLLYESVLAEPPLVPWSKSVFSISPERTQHIIRRRQNLLSAKSLNFKKQSTISMASHRNKHKSLRGVIVMTGLLSTLVFAAAASKAEFVSKLLGFGVCCCCCCCNCWLSSLDTMNCVAAVWLVTKSEEIGAPPVEEIWAPNKKLVFYECDWSVVSWHVSVPNK